MIAIYGALKTAGLRPTSSRVAVLKLFHEFPHEHFAADQVFRKLSNDSEPCSLASVYRALSQLHDADLITSASLGDARIVYELNRGQRHYHLVCNRCGRIQDAYDPGLEQQQARIAADHRFQFGSANLVIFGRCAECTTATDSASRIDRTELRTR
jgi:Fur family transcriptional regulator, ferric uptake regulator